MILSKKVINWQKALPLLTKAFLLLRPCWSLLSTATHFFEKKLWFHQPILINQTAVNNEENQPVPWVSMGN